MSLLLLCVARFGVVNLSAITICNTPEWLIEGKVGGLVARPVCQDSDDFSRRQGRAVFRGHAVDEIRTLVDNDAQTKQECVANVVCWREDCNLAAVGHALELGLVTVKLSVDKDS